MHTKSTATLAVVLFAALGAGCASTPPTPADKMLTQAEETEALGKQWQDGKKLVVLGQSIKQEGEDIVAQGEQKIQEGERLIQEGTSMMDESEILFKQRFPTQSMELYKQ